MKRNYTVKLQINWIVILTVIWVNWLAVRLLHEPKQLKDITANLTIYYLHYFTHNIQPELNHICQNTDENWLQTKTTFLKTESKLKTKKSISMANLYHILIHDRNSRKKRHHLIKFKLHMTTAESAYYRIAEHCNCKLVLSKTNKTTTLSTKTVINAIKI